MNRPSTPPSPRRLAITVRGVVQGVGFRPFVYNAARRRKLTGWVMNEADAVQIEVQGDPTAIEAFLDDLRKHHPSHARVDAIEVHEISPLPLGEGSGVRACTGTPPYPHPSPLPEGEGTEAFHPSPLPKEDGTGSFEIRMSRAVAAPRPTIPADLATCPDCLAEIRDPHQRRHNYPFTNCTNCGPRWSIIERLPYDRPRTSMASFAMCPECRAEYDDPTDRRFHAQPIACPRCGPRLQLLDRDGRETAAGPAALEAAVQLLSAGRIVAIKGLGGFQLLADATSAAAVAVLRARKRRPDRPLAIMVPSLDDARRYCEVSASEAGILASHQAPIVLLRRKHADKTDSKTPQQSPGPPKTDSNTPQQSPGPQSGGVSRHSPLSTPPSPLSTLHPPLSPVPGIALGNPYLGVMLPYTPLHHLLMAAVARPVVCTSGNLSEEPMAIDIDDARCRLGSIADAILTHDRPIVRPVDDSIVRMGADGPQVLRRARGFAPLPIELATTRSTWPTILAVGGHLKNAVALSLGALSPGGGVHESRDAMQVVMSAHVGDLDNVPSVEVFHRAIDDLLAFFHASPNVVVCDLHPDYASTRHAERLSVALGVPLLRVQHHHAHAAACMAERELQGPALGFSWDGTGYGTDGTVWGGESLWCEGAEFRRVAHLRTFPLPGGDAAAREPRRSALGLLFEIFGRRAAQYAAEWFAPNELGTLLTMLSQGIHSPRTSSMGRLFDAVAALCGLPPTISFEGQAAMALEYAADEKEPASYTFVLASPKSVPNSRGLTAPGETAAKLRRALPAGYSPTVDDGLILDWAPMIESVLADRAAGVPVAKISARFHNTLADMALAVARRVASAYGGAPIVLSGGCFQNALLTSRVCGRLSAAGFSVYTHRRVPPGDGGIALGQVFLALQQV